MSDRFALARRLEDAARRGERLGLATIVATEGSSYRGAGAWLLVDEHGGREGQLSGGCLEPNVVERCLAALAGGEPGLVTYGTRTSEDELPWGRWGLGIGCSGAVRVLVDPLEGERLRANAALFGRAVELSEPAVLATVLASPSARLGDRVLVTRGDETATFEPDEEVVGAARATLLARAHGSLLSLGATELALEPIAPRNRLIVFGAGDDAIPVVALAVELGWSVSVADHRRALATPERFPGALVAHVSSPRDAVALVDAAKDATAAIVMSHSFARDVEYVAALLPLGLPYLGLLGPKARGEELLSVAHALAPEVPAPSAVFAPVGLDIGSDAPREIALAAVAEVSAVLAGRPGGHLKDRRGPVHERATHLAVVVAR